jgi:hypothetical protein
LINILFHLCLNLDTKKKHCADGGYYFFHG